jgi:parvulin-like peptidyl-prolyl isomerase
LSRAHLIACSALVLATAVGLAACGGSGGGGGVRGDVVARVGAGSITTTTLSHWMSVLAPEHVVPDPPRYSACVAHREAVAQRSDAATLAAECRRQYQALERQVLDFLIVKDWLIGEAADEHVGVSQREVERRLGEKKQSFPNGDAEFSRSLKAVAQTVVDVELEIRGELAAEKIRHLLSDREPKVTEGEISAYYRQHLRRFHLPERRDFDLVEFLPSAASARQVIREVRQGKSIATMSLHESLSRTSPSIQGVRRPLYEAIFAARQNVLIGPVRVKRSYFVFELTQIVPATLESLAQVRGSIEKKLSAAQQRQTLTKFIEAWRRKWIAETDCHPGYVVQKCKQYTGPMAPEDTSGFD